jgi:hypothetical protein
MQQAYPIATFSCVYLEDVMKFAIGVNPSKYLKYTSKANLTTNLRYARQPYLKWGMPIYCIQKSKYSENYVTHTNAIAYPRYATFANAIRHQWVDQWVDQWADQWVGYRTDDLRHATSRSPV